MVKKSWEKKVDNKGFTLVELIVVLVILAILAAILVPALLGYIDRARGSQILLNGKSVLTAAQAEASNAYGTAGTKEDGTSQTIADIFDDTKKGIPQKIATTADLPVGASFVIAMAADPKEASSEYHSSWTVKEVYYQQDGKAAYFDGTSWEEGLDPSVSGQASSDKIKASKTYTYTVPAKSGD